RERLGEALLPQLLTPVKHVTCDNGMTRKTLWRAFDGVLVESVLMRYPDRVTLCVSSQAGCGMNCPFCATGQAALTRNLSTASSGTAGRSASAATAHPGQARHVRQRDDPQDAVAGVRRGAGGVGADALPGPGHLVRVLPSRVRYELPVLRYRPGGADP